MRKNVAVFSNSNKFIRYCTIPEANRMVKNNEAYFTGTRVLKYKYENDHSGLKQQVRRKDKRTCYICNRKIPHNECCTIDHVIPVSRTDKDKVWNLSNIRCCCSKCNNDKGNMTLKEYIEHIMRYRNEYSHISAAQLKRLVDYAEYQEKEYKKDRKGVKKHD